MKISTFLICTNPALPTTESGVFILHTKHPRCLVQVHTFNTYDERDRFIDTHTPTRLSDSVQMAGALSLKMPTAYECIMLFDSVASDYKLESLMRRIADWHYAVVKIIPLASRSME